MIWRTQPTLDALNRLGQNTALSQLGIEISEIGPDYLAGTMPVDARTRQALGLLHGGASCLLAESLGSIAATLCIDFPHQQAVGLEINASHLQAVREGVVTGVARPLRIGRSAHVWEIRISDEQGALVCVARLTLAIRASRPTPRSLS